MSYSNSFPQQRPTLNLDFANSGKLDSRISFSRADTPPTYAAPSAVHYWSNEKHLSSENLVTQSDGSDWIISSADYTKTASQNGPDGSTNATKYTEKANGSTDYEIRSNSFTPIANKEITYSVWLKQTSGSRNYQQLRVGGIGANQAFVTFNLTNGTVDQTGGTLGVSASVNDGPTGWYQCVMKFTPTTTTALSIYIYAAAASGGELPQVTGDTGNSFTMFGAQASTTGETVVNETSGQIHREFAPTLKTAAADAARFEYAADGQSVGLLVESQVSNIFPYSRSGVDGSGVMQFSAGDASIEKQVAIGPDGTLSALKLIADSSLDTHYCYLDAASAPAGSSAYTISCYAKADGEDTLIIRSTTTHSAFATAFSGTFTLTGAGTAAAIGGTATAKITAVGNGWYRCSVTETTDSSPTGMRAFFYTRQTSAAYNGNDFDGILMACFQVEKNSAPSSWIDTGTAGASASRASDSCSVATSSFYTGGPVSVVSEFSGGAGYYPEVWELRDTVSKAAGVNNYYLQIKYSAAADSSVNWRSWANESDNLSQVTLSASSSATKLGFSVDTNSVASCADGGTIHNMTSTVIPDSLDTLYIGRAYASTSALNGHIQRLALYNVALSDTELQALTS